MLTNESQVYVDALDMIEGAIGPLDNAEKLKLGNIVGLAWRSKVEREAMRAGNTDFCMEGCVCNAEFDTVSLACSTEAVPA